MHFYVAFGACYAFYMHIMTHRCHREWKVIVACILDTAKKKMKLTSYCVGLEMRDGEGSLDQTFL